MRFPCRILAALILLAVPACAAPPDGALFNGQDFTGWEFVAVPAADIASVCRLLPGGIVTVAGRPVGFIATTASYENYQLHAEWRWPGKPGNSGVLVHISPDPLHNTWPRCLQIQTKHQAAGDILSMAGATFAEPLGPDQNPPQRPRTAPDSEKPPGEWNTCDITCRGDLIEVSINGVLQNKITRANPHAGRIGFQFEGAPYELRHVRVVRLD